jgi:hypothetical protein
MVTDEQHGQNADRHQPMQQALQRGEALAGCDHGLASVAVRG